MKVRVIFLITMLHICFVVKAQNHKLPDNYLGFGWIVGFGYDRAFFPSDNLHKIPTAKDFFKQRKKYGIRVNEEDNAYEALKQSEIVKIKRKGKVDTLYVTPVLAFYKIYDIESLKPHSEMLQVYSYKGKVDSVFYQFGMDFELKLSVIK